MKIDLLYIVFIIFFVSIYGCQDQVSKNKNADNRIISLSPHITEIIYAIGADDELIAVSDFCRFPLQDRQG